MIPSAWPIELRLPFALQHFATHYIMESTPGRIDTEGFLRLAKKQYFKHDPLDHTKRSIRLVQILPSLSFNQRIQCNISHTTTDATYQCLSYRWGDPIPEHEILVNGKPFRVRQNLFDFLNLMRLRSTTSLDNIPLIWIDTLCIDQSSLDERNHQVAQMGAIYRSATLVKIWLGNCTELIEMLQEQSNSRNFWHSRHITPAQTNGKLSPLLAQMYDTYGSARPHRLSGAARPHKQQVLEKEFFGNEYWTRAWITQEIYVARRAIVVLENEEFSIATCMHVLLGCDKLKVHNNNVVKKFALFLGFDNSGLPVIQPGGTSRSFLSLLRQFSNKNCTIPRDRLYSLLSLHCNGDKVAVDYAQPDDELLCRFVECLYEPVGLCSIINLNQSLMPQSERLGTGYIEIDILDMVLEWGPVETSFLQSSTSQTKSLHTTRQLVNIRHSESIATATPCAFLPKVLQVLYGKATLIESPASISEEPNFAAFGGQIVAFAPSESGSSFHNITPPSEKIIGDTILRMYAQDFSIGIANKEVNVWTLYIRLSLVWTMFGTAYPTDLCKNMHRFSYGGICKNVRLGYRSYPSILRL
jgi:hypothetical protein